MKQFVRVVIAFAVAGCSTVAPGSGARVSNEYIQLGPAAVVHVTLNSSVADTAFEISGVADHDVRLPKTNVAMVMLPVGEVTITARAQCYRPIVNHVQISRAEDNFEVDFTFANDSRKPGCAEQEATTAVADAPAPRDPTKLAWVIADSVYGSDWPALDNVEHDKAAMTRVLERGGFQVFTSFNRTRAQLLADEAQFLAQARGSDPRSVIVYMSGHGIGMDGRNYFVPADAPPSPQVGVGDLLDIAEIQQKLALAIGPGTFAILLVDACRSTAAGKAQALFASRDLGIPVNYSTAPGNRSYDSEEGMSAWTKRFVSVADSFPWLGIDQVIMYANRYTKWQSATTQQQQTPVLYGRLSTAVPPLGTQAAPRSYAVATLTQEMQ